MKHIFHKTGAIIATLCIVTFFLSTLIVEFFFSVESVAQVKSLIVFPGLFILIPAIAITGATGFSLSKSSSAGLVGQKRKRMPFIGANGLLILLPAAIFLNLWAAEGSFDNTFYAVQGLELFAGAVNITLMFMNIRDGRKLSRK